MQLVNTSTERYVDIADAIMDQQEFRNDAKTFRGEPLNHNDFLSYGQLPPSESLALRNAMNQGRVQYIIYSYTTPIAYRVDGAWYVPDHSYSKTTTKHQGLTRAAVSLIEDRGDTY